MWAGRVILCFAFGVAFIAFIPIQAEEFVCPSNCRCSAGFVAVTCPGVDVFPVFEFAASVQSLDLSRGHITYINRTDLKAYENLQHLDIRHNELKSVAPGLFSEMETLTRLYIDNNPWSCDKSTLHVLQMELIALVNKNSHLENFDGGTIECFDPPDMKGKRPLYLINLTAHFMHKGNKDDSQPTTPGVIALGVFLVLMLVAAVGGIIWSFRENLPQWITEFWKSDATSTQENKMEAGELETKSLLTDSMKKRRRMSKAIPAANRTTSSSDDDDDDKKVAKPKEKLKVKMRKQRCQSYASSKGGGNTEGEQSGLSSVVDSTIHLKDKLKKQRRQSCGFPEGGSGSDGDESGLSTMVDQTDYLKDKLKEKRRQSGGFPKGDGSSGEESKFTTIKFNLD